MLNSYFMIIRAHHLLCLQGYQGYGYSSEFNHNISKIIQFLKFNREHIIEITNECDEICSSCIHNKNDNCKNIFSDWMIKRTDKKVINKLNIPFGSKIAAKDIFKLTNHHFKTKMDTKGICSGCSWNEKCSWYHSKK